MKRITAMLLLLAILCSLGACGQETKNQPQEEILATEPQPVDYIVFEPMEYPEYTFDHEPTIDEMRQMAVKAMRDMISVQWSVAEYTTFHKTSTGSGKLFEYLPTNTYAGMPYSNADGSLIQWFEFYDPETGRLDVGGDGQILNDTVGNTCAGCVAAAWSTVCASIEGPCGSGSFTPAYNYVPVGGYQSMRVDSFNSFPTNMILEMNGKDVMFSCFAQVQPADSLCSTPDVHAVMVIEPAHLVYNEDGTINPDESYIVTQDQSLALGYPEMTEKTEDGYVYYTGHKERVFTFTELWDLGYIPVTTQEFAGLRPYEKPIVQFSKESYKTLDDVREGNIISNYPICVVRMYLTDSNGEKVLVERVLLDKWDIPTGLARQFPIRQFVLQCTSDEFKAMLKKGETYTLSYEVSVSNGQVFTPVSLEVSG